MEKKNTEQKAAIISMDSTDGYLILLPDHTIAKADFRKLKAFLSDFRNIDDNPAMKDGDQGTWKEDDPAFNAARIYAYITDYDELVLLDFVPFGILFENSKSDYISIRDYARKHGKSVEQIKVFCQKGRIVGAKKINNRAWVIPADAPYPTDNRLTANGKYVGFRERNAKR
jgi:hypothetical protein